MNQTASTQQILLPPTPSPVWLSDPMVNGIFLAGATFQVKIPCPLGVGFVKTVRIATTDAAGGAEQPLANSPCRSKSANGRRSRSRCRRRRR